MAAIRHKTGTVASECLCRNGSGSFRGAAPEAERNNFEQSKKVHGITEAVAATGNAGTDAIRVVAIRVVNHTKASLW